MGDALKNRTVAITEHRYEKELAALITRQGGHVVSCPLLEERPIENRAELRDFVREILAGKLDVMVFYTGVGATFLAQEAESMDVLNALKVSLTELTLVARGPKPHAALSRLGLRVDLAPELPTSEGLLALLESRGVRGQCVGVQLYGTPNPEFCAGLERLGAKVRAIQVYNYGPASDRDRVGGFIEVLLSGQVDALTFTSAPQVASLFGVADEMGQSEALVRKLNENVAVATIGTVTDRALISRGVTSRVSPISSKMAPLVDALAAYFRAAPG